MVRFVLVSDVHCAEVLTPPGDVLIAAGDMTLTGSIEEFQWLEDWFRKQPQKRKLFVPGNHDWLAFPLTDRRVLRYDVLKTPVWLIDEEVHTLGNVRIYGSPWTINPGGSKWAFGFYTSTSAMEKWEEIPEGLDILVTHTPPYGIADRHWITESHLGCGNLRRRLQSMKAPPKVHVFGHIHSGEKITLPNATHDGILYINAAVCDESYRPTNDIVILDYEAGGKYEVSLLDSEGSQTKVI